MRACIVTVLVWLLLGLPGYGMWLGYCEHQRPRVWTCRQAQGTAVLLILGGPLTSFEYWCLTGFAEHGYKWTCP